MDHQIFDQDSKKINLTKKVIFFSNWGTHFTTETKLNEMQKIEKIQQK